MMAVYYEANCVSVQVCSRCILQGNVSNEFIESQPVTEVHLDGAERKLVSRSRPSCDFYSCDLKRSEFPVA